MKKPEPAKLAALSAELAAHSAAIARRVDTWATLLNDTADPETVAGWRSLEKACNLIGHGPAKAAGPTQTPAMPSVKANDASGTNGGMPRRIPRRQRPEGGAMA